MQSDYPGWLREDESGVTLMVAAQPGAKTTALVGLHDGALRVRIAAPALDGRGNAALCAWLAHTLHLTRRDVSIKRGEKSRRKQVALRLSGQEVLARLGPLLERACPHRDPD
jgi:uncharacterized protein (TIGR00251 family)